MKSPERIEKARQSAQRLAELKACPLLDVSKPITSMPQEEFEAIRDAARNASYGKRWPGQVNR